MPSPSPFDLDYLRSITPPKQKYIFASPLRRETFFSDYANACLRLSDITMDPATHIRQHHILNIRAATLVQADGSGIEEAFPSDSFSSTDAVYECILSVQKKHHQMSGSNQQLFTPAFLATLGERLGKPALVVSFMRDRAIPLAARFPIALKHLQQAHEATVKTKSLGGQFVPADLYDYPEFGRIFGLWFAMSWSEEMNVQERSAMKLYLSKFALPPLNPDEVIAQLCPELLPSWPIIRSLGYTFEKAYEALQTITAHNVAGIVPACLPQGDYP